MLCNRKWSARPAVVASLWLHLCGCISRGPRLCTAAMGPVDSDSRTGPTLDKARDAMTNSYDTDSQDPDSTGKDLTGKALTGDSAATRRARFAFRITLPTHELESGRAVRLRVRTLVIQLLWPSGGYIWQTPVDVQVISGAQPNPDNRMWLFDQTRLTILAIALLAWFWIAASRRNR